MDWKTQSAQASRELLDRSPNWASRGLKAPSKPKSRYLGRTILIQIGSSSSVGEGDGGAALWAGLRRFFIFGFDVDARPNARHHS